MSKGFRIQRLQSSLKHAPVEVACSVMLRGQIFMLNMKCHVLSSDAKSDLCQHWIPTCSVAQWDPFALLILCFFLTGTLSRTVLPAFERVFATKKLPDRQWSTSWNKGQCHATRTARAHVTELTSQNRSDEPFPEPTKMVCLCFETARLNNKP